MTSVRQIIEKGAGWFLIGVLVVLTLVTFSMRSALTADSGRASVALVVRTASATATSTIISTTQTPIATATATFDGATYTPSATITNTPGYATATATVTISTTPTQTPTASITPSPTVIPPDATPIPTATMVALPDISDWHTYEDTEFGFRFLYPRTFTYESTGLSNEILKTIYLYDLENYDPGVSTQFTGVAVQVLTNPEQFSSAQAWADAHLISNPQSAMKSR